MIEINYHGTESESSQQAFGPKVTTAQNTLCTNKGNFASVFVHATTYAYAVIRHLPPVSWIPYILL